MTVLCGSCRFAVIDDEWGFPLRCGLAYSDNGKPVRPTLAAALDGERYTAQLRVMPTFGCVQGEPGAPVEWGVWWGEP